MTCKNCQIIFGKALDKPSELWYHSFSEDEMRHTFRKRLYNLLMARYGSQSRAAEALGVSRQLLWHTLHVEGNSTIDRIFNTVDIGLTLNDTATVVDEVSK